MQDLGYNYSTDFQAALGISQLSKADKGIQRIRIAKTYFEAFQNKKWIKVNRIY